jgi:hypothetical protein
MVRYPTRWSIRCWTWLWMAAAPAVGLWLAWKLAPLLRDEFTVGLLIPFGDVCLFFWVSNRLIRQPVSMTEKQVGLDTSRLFATEPSFTDTWLSGGWRTTLILFILWYFSFFLGPWSLVYYTPGKLYACILFALAIASGMVIPWALVPVDRALRRSSPIMLLRAIALSRKRAPYGSYTSFLLRHGLKRPLSVLWLGASVLLALGGMLSLAWFTVYPTGDTQLQQLKGMAAGALFLPSVFCWRRGGRHALRAGLKLDTPRILYLRSFLDDQVKVLRDGVRYRVWLTNPLFSVTRFEEVIARSGWPFGGLLALARPGERLPELGAVRIAAAADWQQTIDRLMEESKHILITAGLTSGLKWEFQRAQTQVRMGKLSLVIPPESAASVSKTWHHLVSDLPKFHAFPENVLAGALTIRFRDNGPPVFLSAEQRSVAAYRLALEACWLPLRDLLEATATE